MIAVDPTVIPLGTRLFVPGYGPGGRGGRGRGDQGQHHRPLDAEHGRRASLGAPDRHDHHLRLAPVRLRTRLALVVPGAARSPLAPPRRPPRTATCGRASRTRFARRPSPSAVRPRSRVDARHRSGALRAQRVAAGRIPASNEKLPVAWAALSPARPRLPLPHRGARRGHARRARPGAATSSSRDTATRRCRARTSRGLPPSCAARDHARHGLDPRRRVGLRQSARRAGMEARRSSGSRRRRCPRSSSSAPAAGPARAAAPARRTAPPHRARRTRRPGRRPGRARDRRRRPSRRSPSTARRRWRPSSAR